MKTEFEFTLPKGYLDGEGNLHRKGVMRLATAMDEIVPLQDPRVKNNPAYATVIILARVITQLGAIEEVSPRVVECFFACDLSYLQTFYRQVNELETPVSTGSVSADSVPAATVTKESVSPNMPKTDAEEVPASVRQESPALM
ncbi:hypothetical protein [cf. Phormidesmis sp. LEGE 11477]|uniref:hypothetical protein n=1 Tax=cf. Phormidesmis sp. LEGE 11477 TaxID=1828680 RepID=UPI001880C54F|nr:hypothetical protein [cf. Phormidesmis sp. LEGE 11477]MBE9062418.1 hypothetical protein [cf. Phormidesmis sp. LEGE 11477]